MFIDEKGKLFGKVSVIDILVIVLIVVGVFGIGFAYKQINANSILTENKALFDNQTDLDTLIVKMRLKEVRDITADNIKVGDEVFASDTDKLLGEVVEVTKEPAKRFGTDINGNVFEGEIDGRYDVIFKVKVPGKLTDKGFMTANNVHLTYDAAFKIKTPAVETTPSIEEITVLENN